MGKKSTKSPEVGDEVTWRSHGSTTSGTVRDKITSRKKKAGRVVAATPDDPQHVVRSHKSGKEAVHKPEALGAKGGAEDDTRTVAKRFRQAVNMSARELERWLTTEESRSAGQKSGGRESTGHRSGRRIVAILQAGKSSWTEDDYAHMRKVIGYVQRHLAQRPSGEIRDTTWRHSLMNWGHDPLK
jgi:hypothetical protein